LSSNKSRITSGNGASKSSGTTNFPLIHPPYTTSAFAADRNQAGYWDAAIRNGDFFAGGDAAKGARKLCLGFAYIHNLHASILD
jgi:hypothetical protein